MPPAKTSDDNNSPLEQQELVGFLSNEEWGELLNEVDGLVREMDDLPFPDVKEKVFLLLAGIDSIHREALHRLVRLFKKGVLEQVVSDPAIHTLMELYDMLPPEDDKQKPQGMKIQWQTREKQEAPQTPTRPTLTPGFARWVPTRISAKEIKENTVTECRIEDHLVLVSYVKNTYYAMASFCANDGSSLANGSLNKFTLTCPNHAGCHYDVRQGAHIGNTSLLECFPVKCEEDGMLYIGVDMDFKPELPAF